MSRMKPRFLDCTGMSLKEAEQWGNDLAELQRDIMFWIGDLARYAESRWPETHHQVWPDWISPGMLARASGVCGAYPKEGDRQLEATYSQYMQNANKPDRQGRLEKIVDAGLTSDESKKADQQERNDNRPRWLLACDINYHLTRVWSSGAGMEAAMTVVQWLQRLVARLKEKGLTDVVCCLDSPNSFRKEITANWEDRYKDRAHKEPEHQQQLQLVEELLRGQGFCCVKINGYEADDVMASYAKQFNGKVTLLTCDKDMRQCLSEKCNMLADIDWTTDETSGDSLPDYKWITAKKHMEGCTYNSTTIEGIPPIRWTDFQTLAGDSTDGVSGARGIGAKIAADLVKEFGTYEAVLTAAREGDERIKPKKREALIEFREKADDTYRLVSLVTDLEIPTTTRI